MASSADTWVKEYNEAVKLSDDIAAMVTILGTRMDSLETLLTKLPGKQQKSENEMNHRRDMLANLRSKVNQMASNLNMSNFENRDSLLGPEVKQADAISRTTGLDNHGVVGLQRQIMREQDEGVEKVEETVVSTKHIALAVNEELDLHTRLIDEGVEVKNSRLQKVTRNVAILNKRTKGDESCMSLLLSIIGVLVLIVIMGLLRMSMGGTWIPAIPKV